MGLDITAYGNVEKIADLPYNKKGVDWNKVEELELGRGARTLTKNDNFPEHCLDLEEAVYQINGESHGFRAGSYSGYNRFRNLLCQVMVGGSDQDVWRDPQMFKERPFFELINFSDCEGTIGPAVSAKLYQDFVDNEEQFLKSTVVTQDQLDREWVKTCYSNWKRAFELAKDHGFVSFH